MKKLFALGILAGAVLSMSAWSATPAPAAAPAASNVLTGEVLEFQDVDMYTYIRIKTKDGETWAAVEKAPVRKGASVTIANPMVMQNFESKGLKKTFPSIVFGTLSAGNSPVDAAHAHATPVAATAAPSVKVAKATGANALTVGEAFAKAASYKDKVVLVRGQVVKYSEGIMGKNWMHLRDGTGDAASGSNDLLVTTKGKSKVGEVVLVSGALHTNKDFGAGYSYKVMIEDATIKP